MIQNEKTKLAQEFHKLVPVSEIEQQEVFVTLLHLLESKVQFFLKMYLFILFTIPLYFSQKTKGLGLYTLRLTADVST